MASKGSSSAYGGIGPRTKLPLVPCPTCGEQIIELECGAGSKVPGAIFFKCVLHERDVPGTCPWFLFQDKYEKLLVTRGLLQNSAASTSTKRPAGSYPELEQFRIAIGRTEGHVQANRAELAPFLADVASLNNVGYVAESVDDKLEKLIVIGKIGALCLVVVAVCVVVGLIVVLCK